jgi:hypothetical protein
MIFDDSRFGNVAFFVWVSLLGTRTRVWARFSPNLTLYRLILEFAIIKKPLTIGATQFSSM